MSSRGLKLLVEEFVPLETKAKLNESPWLKAGVILIMLLIGPLLISKGVQGVRSKHIVSKGREYTGTVAVIISVLWVVTGVVMLGGALTLGVLVFIAPRLG